MSGGTVAERAAGPQATGKELPKLLAFLRRDLLIAWSYRTAFVSDLAGLAAQAILFAFVAQLIDPQSMPLIGGQRPSYLSFVVVGVALGGFVHLGLNRVMSAIRNEQLLGTLEVLFMTPTASPTVQAGLVVYDLVYVPVRTGVFLVLAMFLLDARIELAQLHVALAVLLVFVPLIWGIGAATAAGVLTFRRGSGLVGLGAGLLNLAGGVYFPIELLPRWIEVVARYNPVTIALRAMREALLAGAGWSVIAPDLALLVPMSAAALAGGMGLFELALRRERRRGTLGLY